MSIQWPWLSGYLALVGALGLLVIRLKRMERERDDLAFALGLQLAQRSGERLVHDLLGAWAQHVEEEGLTFDDVEEVAHAFADFLANHTGQTIVAQDDDGGVIVAIPDADA